MNFFKNLKDSSAGKLADTSKLLRITALTGLVLFFITGVLFIFFYSLSGGIKNSALKNEDNFSRLLREYDTLAQSVKGTEKEFERLNRHLDKLEKKTIGVESWLSVLKRRRSLVKACPLSESEKFLNSYRQSIKRAVKAYPWSQPLAAIAAAALVKDTALNNETEKELRRFLPLFTDSAFNTLRLSLHVLLGDFRSPKRAAQLPDNLYSDGTEIITQDLAILKIINGNIRAAAADIQAALNLPVHPTGDFIRFAAEYYYDFGDLLRSAELFSRLEDEAALLRQADALYLADFYDNARSFWVILAETINDPFMENMPDKPFTANIYTERCFYNLAVTAENQYEALNWLEKLVKMQPAANPRQLSEDRQLAGRESLPVRHMGVIRYSRLLPHTQAIAVLESEMPAKTAAQEGKLREVPFIDLEICKRNAAFNEPGRQAAETWLLLDRHPENEYLYQWAAWIFLFHRQYGETKILYRRIGQLQLTWQWLPVYKAIQFMQEGSLEKAKDILQSIPVETAGWAVYANLGRIFEAERSPARALENYELAAANVQNPKTAARIQIRIAKCLAAFGRSSESIRVLEYALDLDPDNVSAQLELDRFKK